MLDPILAPRSVAVVGASRTPGKVGHEVLNNLLHGGFQGRIVPVNPSSGSVLGLPCFKDLRSSGEPVDLAVIVVPAKAVPAAAEDALSAGAQALVVISAGFKESGPEGAALQQALAKRCAERGARLLGPNCLGLIHSHHRLNASFARRMPKPGGLSVISQSGALCTAILDWAAAREVGLAHLVSIGNKADLDESDFLSAFAEDPNSKVIVCYLESISNGDEFVRVAEHVAGIKPVLVLKVGVTQAGAKAASSHTGSLAGADIAYGAAFERAGVVRAETFEALFDYALAFAMQPLPKGRGLAIVTNAGGPGIMAADAAEAAGLKIGPLASEIASGLKAGLPPAAGVGNPVDVLGDADPERYALALTAVLKDPGVDGAVVILTPQAMTKPVETARALAQAERKEKPILVAFMGGQEVAAGRLELTRLGFPDYSSPERAVAALSVLRDYAAWRNRPPRIVARFPVNRRRVERIIARHLRMGQLQVGEAKAKEVLRAYDFDVPPGRLAGSAEEAVEAAQELGFPVAMKIASPDVVHKSDVGGVRLNLSNPEQVRDACELMFLRIPRSISGARLEGVYVEKMCPRGREVILGMTRDPQFGPMLMFGLGGIFVEVMKDVAFHLAPITAEEAMEMLTATKSYALLKGARGQAGVDMQAIAGALQRISQLATDFPQISELDINPFLVGEAGSPSLAADARITLRSTSPGSL